MINVARKRCCLGFPWDGKVQAGWLSTMFYSIGGVKMDAPDVLWRSGGGNLGESYATWL